MKIESLKLVNFRNYNNLILPLANGINIFIGANGEGKTNILESIYVLSLTKSNRPGVEENLIRFSEEIAKIEGMIRYDSNLIKQEIVLTKFKKQMFINNKEIRKNRDYISNFCVIAFTPNDLEIIKGSPNVRRNMLNVDISQLDNGYVTYLNEYNQIIKIRNDYLKKMNLDGNSSYQYLDIINEQMIIKALKIYEYRFSFFEKINQLIPDIYKKITNLGGLKMFYLNSLHADVFQKDEIEKKLREKLKRNFKMELMQGMTLTGPHRDDFSFNLSGIDMKLFSSQGQQRMAVIALKIAEIYLFKEEKGEYPVLLLDDIFSEIDAKKRNKIIKYLKSDIQTIITTTDINDIEDELLINSQIYNVRNGRITKKGRNNYGRRKSDK